MSQVMVWKYWFWLIICGALVTRLAAAVVVQRIVEKTPGRLCLIDGDAEGYWILAGKIAAFEEYSIYDPARRLMRMPGFSALLALPRIVYGNQDTAARFPARLMLAFVGTLACLFTYWLGREVGGELVGLLAGTYTVLSPAMILFSVLFLTETAFAAALLASLIPVAKLVRARVSDDPLARRRLRGLALVCGILIGVATYMRPTWLLVGEALVVLYALFGPTGLMIRLSVSACIGIGLAVTMAPWTIRNAVVTGHFITTTLWVGPSLYDGLNPDANGDSNMQFFEDDNFLLSMSEYEMDQAYRRKAWTYASDHPLHVVWLAWLKQLRYWSPAPQSVQFNHPAVQAIAWLAYLPLILSAAIGAWFLRRDFWTLIITLAPLLYFASLHLLFVGSLRYRLPAEYPLAVLGAVGLVRAFRLPDTVPTV